jgi:hypothetical protein
MRRLTKTPWFGPRRFPNWGWTPITWQGWAVTLVFIAAIAAAALLIHAPAAKVAVELVLIALLLAVSLLTGGAPGWRRW